MFIKMIILDGFKSYRDRVDIGPFDPHFNAITGLNGSGKSNIFDAITFVLGVQAAGIMRCQNMAELVYKGAGVSGGRASASLVFDNEDRSPGKCPPGYEKFSEIICSRTVESTGHSKFFLNSITSTRKQLVELFESVQLNINNPNFMILQGKITTVIGMSPKQILGMIEETVGGNVYQNKRDKTEQEVKNRDRCLDLVKSTINDEIYPEFRRQKDAQERLAEFQSLEYQTTRACKIYAIVKYEDVVKRLQSGQKDLDRVVEIERRDEAAARQCKEQIEDHKKRQSQMKQEKNDRFKSKIDEAEKVMNVEKKKFITVEAQLKAAQLDVEDTKKTKEVAVKEKKQQEKELENYKKKSAAAVNEYEGVKGQIQKAQEELEKAKDRENKLKLGNIIDEEGQVCDARQELMRVDDEINKIQPDYQVSAQQFEEDKRKLENLQRDLKKTPTNDQVERDYNTTSRRVQDLKAEATRRNINPNDSPAEITKLLNTTKARHQELTHQRDAIWNRNFNLSLNYQKNAVDSSQINGCVYELLRFNTGEGGCWSGALEVLAGGLLGHIVVETDVVGRALLKAGLSRRTNVHPLNKFNVTNKQTVSQQELDRKIGRGKAIPAIDLIECDSRYRPIVQQFFGGKVLCDTLETAKKLAYEHRFYSVTKLGDIADPGGTMHGGTRRNLGQLIETCESLRVICGEMKQIHKTVANLQQQLEAVKSNFDFIKQLESAKRDLQNAEETRKLTQHSVIQKEIEELRAKLSSEGEALKVSKKQLDELEKEKKKWTTKVSQIEQLRERGKKDIAAQIAKWEKALAEANKKYAAKQKQFEGVGVDMKSLEALVHDCEKAISEAEAEIKEAEEKAKRVSEDVDKVKAIFDEKTEVHKKLVEESMEWSSEYNQLEEDIRNANNSIHKIELDKIKRGNAKDKYESFVKHCKDEIENLQKENDKVNFEAEAEELSNEDRRKSLKELKAEAEKLKRRYDDVRVRIDVDAAEQFGRTKGLLNSAEDRLGTIEKNKEDLLSTMGKLDDLKLNLVRDAYENINEEFNKMMGTLLPESAAKLVPVNHADLSQGLNIHVQLGGVWKTSLSELSGGQKSLVALALVLSLCMYNPAPFYILDEIDAALDLSHTQNIGVLIKKRFTGTQFVCISLKDGMYSNCNILFQVQFTNGKSEVKRCVRSKK